MNIKRETILFTGLLLFLGIGLCFSPPLFTAAPLQTQPPTAQTAPTPAPSTAPEEGTLTEVAPALFAITEAGGNGNVAFLVTDEGVIVVDSGETPAAGRAILARIRLKTDKPVRYIILTHYHGDHTWGLESFPEAAVVIGQENLLRNLKEITTKDMKEYPAFLEGLRKDIEKLKKEGSPDLKKVEDRLAANLREYEPVKDAQIVFPGITFTTKLSIHLGGQSVEVIYPGPSHTSGSSVVLFPNQKAVHMGDMLFVGSHPYIDGRAGSNTANWLRFLKEVQGWDVEKVIPGHGPLSGKDALQKQALYLEELRKEIGAAIAKGLSLEDAKKAVTMEAYKGLKWSDLLVPNVNAVYKELMAGK